MANSLYMCSQVGHTSYVTCLAYIPPGLSAEYPNGGLVTGKTGNTGRPWLGRNQGVLMMKAAVAGTRTLGFLIEKETTWEVVAIVDVR
jgi:hypothetical protein